MSSRTPLGKLAKLFVLAVCLAGLVLILNTAAVAQSKGQLTTDNSRVTFFGAEGDGSTFVYVFDRSGSMSEDEGKPLKVARRELKDSLQTLTEVQKFSVVAYNHRVRTLPIGGGGLVFATDANKRQAERFIDGVPADGGTQHAEALLTAVRMRPDVIFLLTDGDADDDIAEDDIKRVERANAGTIIHVIQFSRGGARQDDRLMSLARRSGGRHVFVDYATFQR
ncbi:MAG: VWA domain-containing protein [Pirellulales bacterium]